MIKLKTVWLLGLMTILLFSLTCQMNAPNEPDQSTKVILNIRMVDSGQTDSPSRGLSQNTMAKLAQVLTVDQVKVVFYHLEADLEKIVHEYDEKYDDLVSLWADFPGDQSDFENYWIARDQAEFNIITNKNYWIEKRANLTVSGGRAYGEFELSEGSKTCRIGCFEQGRLTYVGNPEGNPPFFEIHAGEINTVDILLYQVSEAVNNPPNAVFTVTPITGTIDTIFTFDASSSWDTEDATTLLEVRWDWETDGTWDTNYSTDKITTHQYGTVGSYTVTLEVKDTEDLTGQTTQIVEVKLTGDIAQLDWVTVTGGTFQMGSNSGEFDEQPVHTVTLNTFYINKYEITNSQYCDFLNDFGVAADGSYGGTEYIDMDYQYCEIDYLGNQFVPQSGRDNYPVVATTWDGANAYCVWAGGRLPTEAEWEYAARGGNQSLGYTYSGSNTLDNVGWYDINSGSQAHPGGQKAPNELGLYDMSGNVWEWCNDWYDSDYYSVSPTNNPQGPTTGIAYVVRGGSWVNTSSDMRCANREDAENHAWQTVGFRCAKDQ